MEPVTHENYAKHAERTERIPTQTEAMRSEMAFTLALALKASSGLGEQLDRLKRSIFYGQDVQLRDVLDKLPDARIEHAVGPVEITPEQKRLLHAALGLVTEAIEFAESVSSHVFDRKPFDPVHAREELGDIFWYSAIPVNLFGWTYEEIMRINIEKLRARYPDKWNQDAALNRDLAVERAVLEGNPPPATKPDSGL